MEEHINHFPNLVSRLLSCSSYGAREDLGTRLSFSRLFFVFFTSVARESDDEYNDPRNKPEDDY